MLYRETDFQADKNYYQSFCVDTVGKRYQQWVIPCRILDISPAEYARLLVEEYNAIITFNDSISLLLKHWDNQADARRWKNYINKAAREKNFHI